jgi:putative DNA primase/helicase
MAISRWALLMPRMNEVQSPDDSSCLETASRLIVRGVNTIPLRRMDKRPAVDWKPLRSGRLIERATDQLDRHVLSWWDRTDYGIGAITGEVSNLVVMDVDDDEGRVLVERTCGWPETVAVRTAKGAHLWFAHPGDRRPNRARVGGVGLDVRADGGYVVCPPSVHPSGCTYTWERSPWEFAGGIWPPAEMPKALVELIWPISHHLLRKSNKANGYARAALEREAEAVRTAVPGGRNDQLNRSAFGLARLVRKGALNAREVADVLLAASANAGLPDAEARRTVASAFGARAAL